MTTTERIKKLIYDSGKSDYAIKKETGLGNSVLSDLKAGRAENPSVKTIRILAEYFNVSADYLLCLSDTPTLLNIEHSEKAIPMEQPDNDIATIENLQVLLAENSGLDFIERLYKELQERQKIFVLTWLIGYAQSQGINITIC